MKITASRRAASWFCLIAGTAAFAAAALLFVGTRNLFDPEAFGDKAAQSLSDPGVAEYAAEKVTSGIVQAQPDLIALRPLLLGAARGIVTARPFRALVAAAARQAHDAAFAQGTRELVLALPDFEIVLKSALSQASPELLARIPKEVDTLVATLGASSQAQYLLQVWRLGQQLSRLSFALFVLALPLLGASVWLSEHRRIGLSRLGTALIAGGVVLLMLAPLGALLVSAAIADPLSRGLAQGLWRTFLGDLAGWGVLLTGLGVLFAAGARSLLDKLDPLVEVRKWSRWAVAPPATRGGRAAWASVMLITGVAAAVYPGAALQALIVATGIGAAYLGVREFFELMLETLSHAPASRADDDARGWRLAAGVILGVTLLLAVLWSLWRNPAARPVQASGTLMCNGAAELCAKRVDEVVYPGSHNAMSNPRVAGWMFPHQQQTMVRQLEGGIRALLFDVHYGYPAAKGVKTEMQGEVLTEKVKQAIGVEGFQAALRIRNRLTGAEAGTRNLYLCHGLCELGAYELTPALVEIHDFLVANPDEVLLLIVEDYVSPRDLAAAFESSGLRDFVYEGGSAPWPRLGDLIRSGRRVIVFLESGREGVPWLRPAFQEIRETPYTFRTAQDFRCSPNRGGDAGSLFLLNHWIETTPAPKPSNAAVANSYNVLMQRARQCEAERGKRPNILALDFSGIGDVLKVARELNGLPDPGR